MKINNGNDKQERRHKHYIIPIIYMFSEITLGWLILSIISVDFDITHWEIWAKVVLIIIAIYSTTKTYNIYKRQKEYKREK